MFAEEREPDTPEEEPEGAPGEPGEGAPSDEGAAVGPEIEGAEALSAAAARAGGRGARG